MHFSSSSFLDEMPAMRVLTCWRSSGVEAAFGQLLIEFSTGHHGPLLNEIHNRLTGSPGPRLLIDGVLLGRSFGGISRVWHQILDTFELPGMNIPSSPIAFIDRNNFLYHTKAVSRFVGASFDPYDYSSFDSLSDDNASWVRFWKADTFCSSWISTSGIVNPSCAELALVHDCIPERYGITDPLLSIRRRWLSGASSFLAVSSDSSDDVQTLLPDRIKFLSWCHLAPFLKNYPVTSTAVSFWTKFLSSTGLSSPFILLPGSGSFGSYKNPDLIGKILSHESLSTFSLLITGVNSSLISESLQNHFPLLSSRIVAAGFSDFELQIAYSHATAVVIPSLIEGFGLPAVEVMSAGGFPLISDVRGLREAGSDACLRFDPSQPSQLIALLQLLADDPSRNWLFERLNSKVIRRLSRLNADLFGLALLACARRLYTS